MKYKIIGCVNSILLGVNTIVVVCLMMPFALLKLATPFMYKFWNVILVFLAEQWIRNNNCFLGITLPTRYKITGDLNFDYKGNYLMMANHQSWVDILAMQYLSDKHKMPFMRFFIKKELLYVPFAGLAWWAMDYPRLNRYSKEFLEKNPHKKGDDIKAMVNACKKFANIPCTVTIYTEGTRFTKEKHARQESPYKFLLKPKSGGLATAITVLKERFNKIADVSIYYPDGIPKFWDFLCGKVPEIHIRVDQHEVPKEFYTMDYYANKDYRIQFQEWISKVWEEKDEILEEMASKA